LHWFRARRLAQQTANDWAGRPQTELNALTGDPLIEQRTDAETGHLYMETITVAEDNEGALLTVVVQPIPISGVGALLSVPATASTRVRSGS
jgi:hypothetical protein